MATVDALSPSVNLNFDRIPQVSPREESKPSLASHFVTLNKEKVIQAPFESIRKMFDYLLSHPEAASALNAVYARRGVFKSAAVTNGSSQVDQKYTIDLSPSRIELIPSSLRSQLSDHGFEEVENFFKEATSTYVCEMLHALGELAGVDLKSVHKELNLNFRLCDYNPNTAAPQEVNGCGAHTDYGTFTIIFQDGNSGLEILNAQTGVWEPVSGDSTIILSGWCAYVLSGGVIRAEKHRVRRTPGIRRLSAVLFVAPDTKTKLSPLPGANLVRSFSDQVVNGNLTVEWFKDVMGRRWRKREGNEEQDGSPQSQDEAIEEVLFA